MKKIILPLILILFLTFILIGNCVTELDYMEYANDAAAQAMYVSSDITEDVIESYSEANANTYLTTYTSREEVGQVLTLPACIITSVKLWLLKRGAPTGNVSVRIYAATGTVGTNAIPTGSPLATSNTVAKSSLPTPGFELVTFTFSTPYELTAGDYAIMLYDDDPYTDSSRGADLGIDSTSPSHAGNMAETATAGQDWTGYDTYDASFYIYSIPRLQCYSEDTIKEQGTYSLKGVAVITNSLNETLTRTVDPTIDLTDLTQIKYDIRGSRTGSQIKIGIHDVGGTTTEHTANVAQANIWQMETWDISGVANANKDVIDSIVITVVNADTANTFYVDNMYAEFVEVEVNVIFFSTPF